MEELIRIGDKEIVMRANANTPRKYRETFNRDLISEFATLLKHIDRETGALKGNFDFSIIENLAYIMAKQHDNSIGSIDDFLEQFDGIDDIYLAMGDIVGLWEKSKQATSEPKKNIGQ